jgi:hypothetical protein
VLPCHMCCVLPYPLQPVVEASLWVLRLVLTMCENLLPQHHKLRVLSLPDLTQLAATNTVRSVLPGVLWSGMNPRLAPNRGRRKSPEPTQGMRVPGASDATHTRPFTELRREQIVRLLEVKKASHACAARFPLQPSRCVLGALACLAYQLISPLCPSTPTRPLAYAQGEENSKRCVVCSKRWTLASVLLLLPPLLPLPLLHACCNEILLVLSLCLLWPLLYCAEP